MTKDDFIGGGKKYTLEADEYSYYREQFILFLMNLVECLTINICNMSTFMEEVEKDMGWWRTFREDYDLMMDYLRSDEANNFEYLESHYEYKCLDLNLNELEDRMVKFYFDYHWWGYAFHKTVLNGFILNEKVMDLNAQSDQLVEPRTNVEANKLHYPADPMNGYMESKEFRVKIQDVKVVRNFNSAINPTKVTEDVSYRIATTSIYEDPVAEFADEEIQRRKFYPEFTILFDSIDRDVEVVNRSVYNILDVFSYIGGLATSILGVLGIIAGLLLNSRAEIATWDEMRKKKDDDAADPQDKSGTPTNEDEGPISMALGLKLSLNSMGLGFLCCKMSEKSKLQEKKFQEFREELEV